MPNFKIFRTGSKWGLLNIPLKIIAPICRQNVKLELTIVLHRTKHQVATVWSYVSAKLLWANMQMAENSNVCIMYSCHIIRHLTNA